MTAFLLAAILLPLAGGVAALLLQRYPWSSPLGWGSCIAGSLLAIPLPLMVLAGGVEKSIHLPWPVPAGAFSLHLDPLAGFFLLPILLLSAAAALYGSDYLRPFAGKKSLGTHWFFFNLFVASMVLVVTAANAVLFLAAWELMSLSSFLLVAFEHEREEVRRAAWVYLLATHLGAALLFAFFLLAGGLSGGLDFSLFTPLGEVSDGTASILFILALLGFGAKAGLFPLHVWLPDAHPAAPSHVSAVMSGVMIKTGIYGILRVITWLPGGHPWWGASLMCLGICGAIFGIAMAAMQRDIKRVLAYSTVENAGIIFLALGLALFAAGQGMPTVALTAAVGGLLHIWNHALFKGAMFFGAGSIFHATGTRDLDRMGGLLHRMPVTSSFLVVGSLAIAALPPFNGFVSEWLIYLGLLQAGGGLQGGMALLPLFIAAVLALTGGVAVIVFTRLVGIALLGSPRDEQAACAHEQRWRMTLPMALLLFLCLGIGLFPGAGLSLLTLPAAALVGDAGSSLPPLMVAPVGRAALLLILLLLLLRQGLDLLRRRRPVSTGATWGCGFPFPSARISYTAEGYAELTQTHLLPRWFKPSVSGGTPSGLFPAGVSLCQGQPHPFYLKLFLPLFEGIATRLQRLRWMQQGRLHVYLLYIFVSCAVLLVWSVLSPRWPIW